MPRPTVVPHLRVLGALLAGVLLLALPGCGIPQLRHEDPAAVLPGEYYGATSSENSAQMGIVEFFDDPVLTQLITEGLTQNQSLKIRNEEIQVANYQILSRSGAYLPFVTVGAAGGFDRTSRFTPLGAAEDQLTFPRGGRFPDPLPNTRVSANLFWQIDIWRELRNARDAAIERYYEAVEERNYYITQLVADTAGNYYELAALDKRLEYLDQTIEIQKQSLEVARAQKDAGRGTELPVQRFLAEVRKNESQKLIVAQSIIETENRINFLVGRFPQRVERQAWDFVKLDAGLLNVGVPAELLLNRRDIQAAEREVTAAGLDVLVARAHFFPRLDITAGIGYEAFNPRYLFEPGALIAHTAGELVAPLINKRAIRAEYQSANARQLQAVYDYQQTVINAFTEVANALAKVQNYRSSVEYKQQQVTALEESVAVATDLFQNARAEYVDVLFSQRDLLEARTVLIETKQQQLSAIVNAYQALGGGYLVTSSGMEFPELFCPPWLLPGTFWPAAPAETPPAEAAEPTAPAVETMPAPLDPDAVPAPAEDAAPENPADDDRSE